MTPPTHASSAPVERLLQRLTRQFSSNNNNNTTTTRRPPDAASAALGRALAEALLRDPLQEAAIFPALVQAPPSVAHALLHAIQEKLLHEPDTLATVSLQWVARWLLQAEQHANTTASNSNSSSIRPLLDALRRVFAALAMARFQLGQSADIAAFQRLQFASNKLAVWRHLLQRLDNHNNNNDDTVAAARVLPPLATPFLVVTVFTKDVELAAATLQVLFRHVWMVWTSWAASDCMWVLQWMTDALQLYIQCLPMIHSGTDSDERSLPLMIEVTETWLGELAMLAQAVARQHCDEDVDVDAQDHHQALLQDLKQTWILQTVLGKILPTLLLAHHSYAPSDRTLVLQAIQGVMEAFDSAVPIDDATAWRLAVCVLHTPDPDTRFSLLQVMLQGIFPTVVAQTMVYVVAIWTLQQPHEQDAHTVAALLLKQLTVHNNNDRNNKQQLPVSPAAVTLKQQQQGPDCLVELLSQQQIMSPLILQIVETCDFCNVALSPVQQVEAMLFGIAIMAEEQQGGQSKGIHFLTRLLQYYPHLGISLLPIVMDRINVAARQNDIASMMQYFEFLCGPLVKDAVCAQEVWNLVGQQLIMQEHAPTTLKLLAIRQLPILCESNKRLYRRAIETIGVAMGSKTVEIRLAVAATLADLAKQDLIRDVSDVIGWLQTLLTTEEVTPMHSLLIHYAVMSLHYLVRAQELDFEVVIKVLNKRLCPIANVEAVSKQTPVVQEALVLLLGDGECSDDEEDKDERPKPSASAVTKVSPQVKSAIATLIGLGQFLEEKSTLSPTQERVRMNIYTSLCNYSVEALEMDTETIRAATTAASTSEADEDVRITASMERYFMVRDLVLASMKRPSLSSWEETEMSPVVEFARKMLHLEEEAIGSMIWKRKISRRRGDTDKTMTTKSVQQPGTVPASALPLPAEIRETALERSSPGASIALLMVSDGSQLSSLRDNGDVSIDSSDPLWVVFALQAFLHVTASVLSNTQTRDEIGDILTEVGSWYEVFVAPDTMYLAFATLSIYIPHQLREEESTKPYVEELYTVILEAFQNQRFQKDDIAKICISLVAVSTLRYGSLERVEEVLYTLEQSIRGYGGEQTFGAYYGLALICQALQIFRKSDVFLPLVDEVDAHIFRICGFLVEELLGCHEECDESLLHFVECLKSGNISPDLVLSMSDLDSDSISLLMTKSAVARSLFISCALCLPGIAVLNDALHLATLRMMECFEWGGGKGIALPPMLHACNEAGLFTAEELNHIYRGFGTMFETKMTEEKSDLESEGLDDLFYAFNSTTSKSTSHGLRRAIVGNRDLFDENGCVMSLIAVFNQIAPLPCLGAAYFTTPVQCKRGILPASDHESILEIIRESAKETESKHSDMAIILMALLSSLRDQRELKMITESLPKQAQTSSLQTPKAALGVLDFDSMPRPQTETILAGLIDDIELQSNSKSFVALVRDGNVKNALLSSEDMSLVATVQVLEVITLPDQFVSCFLKPLMQLGKCEITERCTSLLCYQLKGRRRAAFETKQFAGLAFEIASSPLEEWDRYLKEGQTLDTLVLNLPGMLSKFPPDDSVLDNMWRNSFARFHEHTSIVRHFLSSAKELLSSSTLSSKLTNSLRQLVVTAISEDILDLSLSDLRRKPDVSTPSILELYTQCIGVMPRSTLEECDFFNVSKSFDGFGSEVKKVISILTLIQQNYFTRVSEELSNIGSWLTRKLNTPNSGADLESFYVIMTLLASLSVQESSPVKCTRLLKLLEVLLTFKAYGTRLGIQWLSVLLAYLSRGEPVEEDLSLGRLCVAAPGVSQMVIEGQPLVDFFRLSMKDLHVNLSAFAAREKISSTVANHINRLFTAWSDLNIDADILECLRHTNISCQRNLPDDEVFLSLASSSLLSVYGQ